MNKINKAFPVFSYGDAHRNSVLGLDSIWINKNQIKGIEDSFNRLRRNLLEFLNTEFPRNGRVWCETVCDLKMQPIRERIGRAKRTVAAVAGDELLA